MSNQPVDEVSVSIVVGLHNAAPHVERFHDELWGVLEGLPERCEIIFVDDGSTDETAAALLRLFQAHAHVRVIRFARQFGVPLAHTAGLRHARGRRVVIVDVDVPASLTHIPEFLDRLEEGYDIVYADSRHIRIPLYQRIGRILALKLIRQLTEISLPDSMNGIIALSNHLVQRVNQYNEKKRSMDSLFAYLAYGRFSLVTVTPRENAPKMRRLGIWRLTRSVLSMIVSHSTRPLLIAFWTGAAVLAVSVALFAVAALRLVESGWSGAWAPLIVALTVCLAGLQLLAMGILGEYVGRIYGEVLERPLYTIAEILEHDPGENAEFTPANAQTTTP